MPRSKGRWWRDLALAVALVGSGAAIVLVAMHPGGHQAWPEVVGIVAGGIALCGIVSLPFAQRAYGRELRLRRGTGVRGRWKVSALEWNDFLRHESQTDSDGGARLNLVDIRQRVEAQGLEIVVGQDAVLVGNEFLSLIGLGVRSGTHPAWVDGSPAMIEYSVIVTDATDTLVDRVVRFPVDRGHEELARSLTVLGQDDARAEIEGDAGS